MRSLIVEDSRLARQELKHLLKGFPEIELIGEAADADEALALIESSEPDLLFLDIQMPGKDGFELLEQLDQTPEVIFTTAYDQYALKAFDYNALDYLQKPIQIDRLGAAIEKASTSLRKRKGSDTLSSRPDGSSETVPKNRMDLNAQVFVKDGDNCWFVRLADIRLMEVEGSYSKIHFDSRSPMIPKTLNYLESRLDPSSFFRANRQQIINLKAIKSVEPWFSGGLKITLSAGEEIEVSRRQASRFKELMSF
ncbi:LytTR family DNA-binding domain-containing protein [Pelagicoccus sp. SDUM812003]|uniref:LytR/AlgR family response regulator transcription factor n=1 Tax=Pelagicoccus sp. SDUM812003 TaxID=3041267 RepID=UPI00280EC9FB|nr:LytTR family DNA-binding domain-containing protein [Pelagicoccus sp. SDUM812003]MDQ8203413.1 LytTR family DNA-binding domain-containing protein [Pelagicoccus sp. SDUM812003]